MAAIKITSIKTHITVVLVGLIYLAFASYAIRHLNDLAHEYATVWKMSSVLGKEADVYFEKYLNGDIVRIRSIPLLGGTIEVDVVTELRGASYGFVKYDNRFFCAETRGLSLYSYKRKYLFVVMKDWYIHELIGQGVLDSE